MPEIETVARWGSRWIAQTTASGSATFYASNDAEIWRPIGSLVGARLAAVSGERLLAVATAVGDTRMWVSADAKRWEPVAPIAEGTKVTIKVAVGGPTRFVAIVWDGFNPVQASADGRSWRRAEGLADLHDAVAVVFTRGRFVLLGTKVGLPSSSWSDPAVWTSSDGQRWVESSFPPASLGGLDTLSVARAGLVLSSTTFGDWMHSGDGLTWEVVDAYAPVGRAWMEGDPPAMCPNGWLVSDGDRILAVDGNGRGWTSFDGREWKPLDTTVFPGLELRHSIDCSFTAPKIRVLPRGLLAGVATGQVYGAAH